MTIALTEELAASAARLVVEEGLEYAAAKRKAARDVAGAMRGGSRVELPSNETVEDAVREHIALFCADTQPAELAALRGVALTWMERLSVFRPHLSGAVWRGTATRLSAIHIDLYADDAKAPEIALINQGIDYDTAEASGAGRRGEPLSVLSLAVRCADLKNNERVTVHLTVRDHDDLRGALVPDASGRTWRGDARALQRLIEAR
jgi:hypothetical protein